MERGLILAAIGALAGGLYLYDRAHQPGGGGPAGVASGLAVDPGGGTALVGPNPLANFPLYYGPAGGGPSGGSAGTGSSTVTSAAAAGAAGAPLAGQAATAKALSTGGIAIRNTSGAGGADAAAIAGTGKLAPIGGANISTRQNYQAPAYPGQLGTVAAFAPIAPQLGGLLPGILTPAKPLVPTREGTLATTTAFAPIAPRLGGLLPGVLTPAMVNPTTLLAQRVEAARVAAFQAVLAQPHPSISTRTFAPPAPPKPVAPPVAAPRGRSSGTQTL